MSLPDSIRFKKESARCETAAKIASFLESYVPAHLYDFVLPDLLYFRCEKALLELRETTVWQAFESEFIAFGGLICEDWESESEIGKPVKVLRPIPRQKSRAIGLVLVIIVPAIIGGTLGWFFPPTPQTQVPSQRLKP